MIFNRIQVGFCLILPLAFAGCMTDSSSTGAGARPAPLQKAERTSFVNYLHESSEVVELSTVTISPGNSPSPGNNPRGTEPLIEDLTLPLMHLAANIAPTAGATPQDLRALLNQELSSGKCKLRVTGAPTSPLPPGQPVTMQTSLGGPGCSFESAATIKAVASQGTPPTHVVTDMNITFALKSERLLSSYDVSSVDLQASTEIKTDPAKSVTVNLTMATKQQSKLHGVVTTSVNMASTMPLDQKGQATIAIACRFQSKDWNVVFAANASPGVEPTATLNGEKLSEADEDIVMAITKSFSMFQPRSATHTSNADQARRSLEASP